MRRNNMETKRGGLHSVLAIRSGKVRKTSKYLRCSKHPLFLLPQSSSTCHAVFLFLIPVLLGVLQLQCQATNKSPFETHLPNMLMFLFALFIYSFAYYFYSNITSQLQLTDSTISSKLSAYLALFSGSLASVSLVSVMLPPALELFAFIIWIISLIIYFSFNHIVFVIRWLYLSSKTAASYIFALWKRIIRRTYGGDAITV